ncbi:MAG: AAA family ATPase [Porphyromonadaceae bacterium]|nr:AAA family ATPase [Porphyromonadaceae bacterium]
MISTTSLFKLSIGSNKVRPYFKQFEADGIFPKLIRNILLPKSAYKISLYKNDANKYAALWLLGFDNTFDFEINSCKQHIQDTNKINNINLQQIFYGAPGTGKSYRVKCETEEWEKKGRVVRTTFHPDSDYSTFVGCYKPTTQNVPRYDIYNNPVMNMGEPVMEQVITYEFVAQAFLQAYIAAWTERDKPEYLIIEEINRGNCAQIFGDLFQLLDRGDDGCSEYAIRADKDLQKYLQEALKDVEIPDYPKVKSGEELLLPANLYIRATMNTSDQSLFPIDSAFKRRWDWQYVPIARDESKDWKIEADGKLYDWWQFLETINKIVFTTTNSEDKQLGFYFCKADKEGIIRASAFVSKVIFYLWNDVFKDFGFDDQIFKDEDGDSKLSFDKFYDAKGEVIARKVVQFLSNLKLEPVHREDTAEEEIA